jgi:ligand-binding sensor domain-containing protein
VTYDTGNSDLPSNYVYTLHIAPNGDVWAGTGGGAATFDGASWTVYHMGNSGLSDNNVVSIAVANNDDFWLGTLNFGADHYDGQWTNYAYSNSGIGGNNVYALEYDDGGVLWAGTSWGGLARWNGADFDLMAQFEGGNGNNAIRDLEFDPEGVLWIGRRAAGASRFDVATEAYLHWTIYDSGLPSTEVWGVSQDACGNVWLATTGGGVAVFDAEGGVTEIADGIGPDPTPEAACNARCVVNASCGLSTHGACASECLAELEDAADQSAACVDAFTELNVCLSELLCSQMDEYIAASPPFPCQDEHEAYYGAC